MSEQQTIARTILEQLGGNHFIVMTGAKNFVAGNNCLSFRIGRNSKGINQVRVFLNAMDTYDIDFLKVRKFDPQVAAHIEGVYFDQLQKIFTAQTGLYTHL